MEKYEHLIGGFLGGVTSTVACHPLDLLKIRYSANEGNRRRPQYRSYWHAVKSIVAVKGYKGLYQGLSPNLIGSALSWGLYFQFYHVIKDICKREAISTGVEPIDNILFGIATGSGILAFTNPIWVAKTRLCLQYEKERIQYNGFLDCMRTVVRNEGFGALYKGFVPGVIGTAHGALQFMLYNRFKENRLQHLGLPSSHTLGTVDCLVYSGASKMIATTITFPYQVMRTRLQDHHANYRGMYDLISKTYTTEGMRGFYKGLIMGNLRQLPNVVVTYIVYENVRYFIRHFSH